LSRPRSDTRRRAASSRSRRRAHPAGPHDLARKVKIRLRTKAWPNQVGYRAFADEFWPEKPRTNVFQPEPGCSEPTFRGSQAEVGALALAMLLWAGAQIARGGEEARALLTALPTAEKQPEPRQVELAFAPDVLLEEAIDGYQVRLAPSALAEIRAHIRRNDRALDSALRDGGLLFGERDDATRVSGSARSPGRRRTRRARRRSSSAVSRASRTSATRSAGAASAASPSSAPGIRTRTYCRCRPTATSRHESDRALVRAGDPARAARDRRRRRRRTELGAYLFDRADLRPPHVIRAHLTPTAPEPAPAPARDVGLALSGGGFRALAFHLGCLRALNDRGVLERVFVVSGVSGGSLAAALYAYSDGELRGLRPPRR
jgi:hypothetical protein